MKTACNTIRIASSMWLASWLTAAALAGPLDEMAVDRWAKLREAERYQMNVAERLYRDLNWIGAAAEYEKFLKLYETSEGASFAQLKWSYCMVHTKKLNTAIKDGFQSVVDYWPDVPEAIISAYKIGETYKNMGDIKAAKKAYAKLLADYPTHLVATLARHDLANLAKQENDPKRYVEYLRQLTFESDRKGDVGPTCRAASIQLAQHHFYAGQFADGLKALATSYSEYDLPPHLMAHVHGHLPWVLSELRAKNTDESKAAVAKLTDEAVKYLQEHAKQDAAEEKRKRRGVECLLWAADVYANAGQPEKQRVVYDQLLATLGPNDEILGRIGDWFRSQNKREEARQVFAKFQDSAAGQSRIAYTFREDGKPDQALAIYRDLIASDPKQAPAYQWQIGETLYHAHRWQEARDIYRSTEQFPTNYQRMADCERALKRYDEAISLYQQILVGHPPSASWAVLQIGYTHEQAARTENAIKMFKQVCDKYPKSGEASQAHVHLNNKYKITVTLGGAAE